MNYRGLHDWLTFIGGSAAIVGGLIGLGLGLVLNEACKLNCERQLLQPFAEVLRCSQDCPDAWLIAVLGAIPGVLIMGYRLVRGPGETTG